MGAFFKSKNNTPVIGIDLGSGYIKLAQFKQTGKDLSLVNFGILPMTEGAMKEGRIADSKEVGNVIKELLQFHSFVGNRIVAALPGQLAIVKEVLMEELPEDELSEAVKWEMEKFLPFPVDQATFDYKILNSVSSNDGTSDKLNLLVVAAPLDAVESIADALKAANLKPVAIEVEPFSKLRVLRFMTDFNFNSDMLLAVVNIGYTYTSISMVNKGMVNFFRTLPMGGKKFTEAIAQFTNKNFKEAEEIKRKQLDLADKENVPAQAILPLLDSLLLEVSRSIDYYFKKFNEGKAMETIILIEGGSANLKGIDNYFEKNTSFVTRINRLLSNIVRFNPNLFTKEYLYEMAPSFSVVAGLALREHHIETILKARKKNQQKKKLFDYKKGIRNG